MPIVSLFPFHQLPILISHITSKRVSFKHMYKHEYSNTFVVQSEAYCRLLVWLPWPHNQHLSQTEREPSRPESGASSVWTTTAPQMIREWIKQLHHVAQSSNVLNHSFTGTSWCHERNQPTLYLWYLFECFCLILYINTWYTHILLPNEAWTGYKEWSQQDMHHGDRILRSHFRQTMGTEMTPSTFLQTHSLAL